MQTVWKTPTEGGPMSNPEVEQQTRHGSCLCGGVAFEVRSEARPVTFCHCEDCRKTTGHFHAAIGVKKENFTLTKDETLKWYASSEEVRRGFCDRCGGNLFWQREGTETESISVQAGMFDVPTGLEGGRHIFVGSKSDYYEITDNLPKVEKW